MDRIASGPLPGGGFFIACGRRRKPPPCATCRSSAQLECDGCDKPLCFACGVSPRKGLDFCPGCFKPAFEYWKGLAPYPAERNQRRMAFREWTKKNAEKFLELVPLGAIASRAKPAPMPHDLWRLADEDPERYRALMVEHGHLKPKLKT